VLAYSSIAHAGFVLTGVVALTGSGITAVLFYLLAYGAATVGAFGIVTLVRERGAVRAAAAVPAARVPALAGSPAGAGGAVAGAGDAGTDAGGAADAVGAADADPGADAEPGEAEGPVLGEATHLSQWAGLGRTSPVLATTFALFLLSFAGIPLTAGFTGKFAVFSAAVEGGAWPLAVVGVLASAAAAFFYVRIIVLMFFTAPQGGPREDDDDVHPAAVVVPSEGFTVVAVAVCAAITVVLGVFPGPVLDAIASVAQLLP
jgi:NADH-quinone oxidoreductase subunit N